MKIRKMFPNYMVFVLFGLSAISNASTPFRSLKCSVVEGIGSHGGKRYRGFSIEKIAGSEDLYSFGYWLGFDPSFLPWKAVLALQPLTIKNEMELSFKTVSSELTSVSGEFPTTVSTEIRGDGGSTLVLMGDGREFRHNGQAIFELEACTLNGKPI